MLAQPPAAFPASAPVLAVPPQATETAADELRSFIAGLVRFTVEDATRMTQLGILPEDGSVELLDGLLARRMCGPAKGDPHVEGDDHNFAVAAIGNCAAQINTSARHLRTQSLLIVTDSYAPYPDAVILRGPVTDYRGRRPVATDALCAIEVADSSYERDAGPKLAAYAAAGIPQYVIIDLRRRLAEVYADPHPATGTYPPPLVVSADGTVGLRIGDGQTFPVRLAELLP